MNINVLHWYIKSREILSIEPTWEGLRKYWRDMKSENSVFYRVNNIVEQGEIKIIGGFNSEKI